MYSLQRKSYVGVLKENFPETLKSLAGFVTCGSLSGIGFGIVYNMNLTEYSLKSDERMIPTILAFGAVFYAKKIYDNFKLERERMHQLVTEMENERIKRKEKNKKAMEGFITPDQMSRLQFQKSIDSDQKVIDLKKYRDILSSQDDSGISQGKRKSLNNGIHGDE